MQSFRNRQKLLIGRARPLTISLQISPTAASSDWVAGVLLTDLSDHFPIFLNISCKLNDDIKHDIFVRNYSRYNTGSFNSCISRINWDTVYCESNANSAYNAFFDIFNRCFPITRLRLKSQHSIKQPWIISGIITSIKRKINSIQTPLP